MEFEVKIPRPHELLQPTRTIEDLDDRLLRIVCANLDDFDLSSFADVNVTFSQTAQAVITSRYEHAEFRLTVKEHEFRRICEICKLAQDGFCGRVPSLLRNFGKFINSLHIHLNRKCFQEMLESVHQYCGESLSELLLEQIDLKPDHISKMRPLLSRITKFKLLDCRWETGAVAVEMSSLCSELELLNIQNRKRADMDDMSFFDGVHFPKLFTVVFCGAEYTTESIHNMIKVNPQLKEIQIHCSDVTSEIFPAIVRYVPQIEKLTFLNNFTPIDADENTNCLQHLTALKSLQMNFSCRPISSIISGMAAAQVPLECLELSNFRSNRAFYRDMSKLKKLKKLKLSYGYLRLSNRSGIFSMIQQLSELTHLDMTVMESSRTDLAGIIRSAPKLRKLFLQFSYCHPKILTEAEYEEIVNVVTSRAEKCHLKIFLISALNILIAPIALLKSNEDKVKFIYYCESEEEIYQT